MADILKARIPRELVRAVVIFVVVMGVVIGVHGAIQVEHLRMVFMDVVPPAIELVVGIGILFVARRVGPRSTQLASAWAVIGSAVLVYAAGDLVWAYLELGTDKPPFPSLADVFYLLYYPLFLFGALNLVSRRVTRRGRLNLGLDLGAILVAAALAFWNLLIGPVVEATGSEPMLNRLILVAYPVGDLVLFAALILVVYYQTKDQDLVSTFFLALALVVMIVTDCIYAYQTLAGMYGVGSLLDFGWIAAHVLTGLAALPQLSAAASMEGDDAAVRRRAFREQLEAIRTYLPYAGLLIAYILLLRASYSPMPMSALSLTIGMGAIVVLVLMRQFTTLSENTELTSQLVSKAYELEDANRYLAVEVSERKRIEQKLSYDTLHDGMTGLPNRALFLDRLGQAIEYSQRHANFTFAVLFIDIDHFKVVNDSLGHMVGDQVLWAIGARLKGTLRSADTLARFGGDEFAILMDAMGQDDSANRLAERIQAGLQRPFKVEGHELHMSASIGVVTDVAHYERAGDLLRDADLAMYEAKSRGKARFESFDVEMRNQAFLRLDIEGELRKGLEKDELHVHYQPVISLKTGRIVSFEALVRWMHPTRGLLLPRQFLAVAEETGLILPMGEHVLHTACSDMQGFHDDNPDARSIGVSVNISNKQFTQPGLKGVVEKAVAQSGLDPRRLRLEITERVLIGNLRTASRVFADLRGMGVRFDIDDFGTGYSALAYLQNFPIQALKIDRGFIENMQRDRKGLGLVRAIVSMAHELGMETVAEGVTNNRQLRRLKALGCDYAQGTLMSRPLRPRGVEQLLQQTAGGSKRLVIRTSASPRKTASRSSSRSAPGSVRAHAARVGASRRRRSR